MYSIIVICHAVYENVFLRIIEYFQELKVTETIINVASNRALVEILFNNFFCLFQVELRLLSLTWYTPEIGNHKQWTHQSK